MNTDMHAGIRRHSSAEDEPHRNGWNYGSGGAVVIPLYQEHACYESINQSMNEWTSSVVITLPTPQSTASA